MDCYFWGELVLFHFGFFFVNSGSQFLCFSVVLLFRVSLLLRFALLACFSAFSCFSVSLLLCFSAPLIFCFSAFLKTLPDPKQFRTQKQLQYPQYPAMEKPWVSTIFHPRLGFTEASLWAQRMHRRHRIQRLRRLLRGATKRARGARSARRTAPEALLKLMQAVLLLLHLLS